jgi:DMSO/TMAO reductase YedYZ molybdopterin-dependent catalytic subunit
MKKPGILNGAYTGLLLAVPVVALFYFGWKILELPFVPFDIFDMMSRLLPGAIITFAIENMVSLIRSLHLGQTAVAAKALEQTQGVLIFLVAAIVAGIITSIVLRIVKSSYVVWSTILGAVFAIPIEIITLTYNMTSMVSPVLIGIWIAAIFLAWGVTFGLIYRRALGFSQMEVPIDSGRRRFFGRLAGIAVAITAVAVVPGILFEKRRAPSAKLPWSATHPLPNADATVIPAPGTRPEFTPVKDHYRIDIDTMPPHIDMNSWRLQIKGLVDNPREYTVDEIRNMPAMSQFITLECISNPIAGDLISTQRWTGTSLKLLLAEWGVKPEATHIDIVAVDGFHETIAIDKIISDERIMLCYDWDGLPLPDVQGFPLRIYIPDRYGMKQPKWIESMEAVVRGGEGYWVERGWDRQARVKATSAIDTVAVESKITATDGNMLVPVGGIAYSGARGISKVELQVDGEQWREAQLRTPLSDTTWVIWRYDYPYEQGEHTFTVRCYERDGTPQVEEVTDPHPSGATGLHSLTVRI